jgi:hypothetical protein
MGDLLDLDGVWDEQLMGLMLPVAMELQADDAQIQFGAVSAAVSQLAGGKAAREFRAGLGRIRDQARKSMRAARGLDNTDERITSAADSMLELAKRLKIRVPIKKKSAPSAPTKIHGGPK